MTANTKPIYSRTSDIQWAPAITADNTAKDGTGTVATVFTADATEGGFVRKLRLRPLGTNTASVCRVFLNNGSTNAVADNNTLYDEVSLPATSLSETASMQSAEIQLDLPLPPGYRILITIGTAVAAGWAPTVIGGKY